MEKPQVSSNMIKPHFPVNVMSREHKQVSSLNSSIGKVILELESKFKHTKENAATEKAIATSGGYQTSKRTNLFRINNGQINELYKSIIEPAAKEYIDSSFQDKSKDLRIDIVGWSNVLRQGDWQRPHCHPTPSNLISGVYYVSVPEDISPAGEIEFLNPLPISMHHGYSPSKRIKPKEGMLLLFPPYHMHYVHPVMSDEPRIVIAFDIQLKQNNLEFIF